MTSTMGNVPLGQEENAGLALVAQMLAAARAAAESANSNIESDPSSSGPPRPPPVDENVMRDVITRIGRNEFNVHGKHAARDLSHSNLGVRFRAKDVPDLISALGTNEKVCTVHSNAFQNEAALSAFVDAAAEENSGMRVMVRVHKFCSFSF